MASGILEKVDLAGVQGQLGELELVGLKGATFRVTEQGRRVLLGRSQTGRFGLHRLHAVLETVRSAITGVSERLSPSWADGRWP